MADSDALPPHLIRRVDVAAWLRDSQVAFLTTHRTTPEAARRLHERGVRIEETDPDSRWGQGFTRRGARRSSMASRAYRSRYGC